jgi:hypothetical protein
MPNDPLGSMAGAATGAVSSAFIRGFLLTFGSAFLLAMEHGMMMTGLVSPIFLGLSFVTKGWTAITSWAIGYFGFGLVLLFYKLQIGLVSLTILKAPATDPLLYPLVISIFSIITSFILVGGGGIAIFTSLARSIPGPK